MEEKTGLLKLGYVHNYKPNKKGESCCSILSRIIGREIKIQELNKLIDSPDFTREFIGQDGALSDISDAVAFRFKLPFQSKFNEDVYGYFKRNKSTNSQEEDFVGVFWGNVDFLNQKPRINLRATCGYINSNSWKNLSELCGDSSINERSIHEYISAEPIYINGAGFTQFSDGTAVTRETGKFIKITTSLKTCSGDIVVGWFVKNLKTKTFEGINWGSEEDFQNALKEREKCYVGRMVFDSIDACNDFMDSVKNDLIDEVWEFEKNKDSKFRHPILKSYLQHVLDRLFYEAENSENADRKNKIIYNKDRTWIYFHTNLLDKYGQDFMLMGQIYNLLGKEYIGNFASNPQREDLERRGFEWDCKPVPPRFFYDINEIIFHGNWDMNDVKYEHIIDKRLERFPEKYRKWKTEDLGRVLNEAIRFACSIANRNYRYIVPMYYPKHKRIQLLMPIYLKIPIKGLPDFALVLTPNDKGNGRGYYTAETILELEEVYQDARLIAKPEESWLNNKMIK